MTESTTENFTETSSESQALAPVNREQVSSHFWVSSYPFFESTLFLVPSAAQTVDAIGGVGRSTFKIDIFDSDGAQINESKIEFPSSEIHILELEPLLGACKLESGMKHAHVVVTCEEGMGAFCRVHTRDAAAMVGSPVFVSSTQGTFFPCTISPDRLNLVCFVNRGDTEATLRCRLFFGKRSPEASWVIPANASRVISIENEFKQYTSIEDGEQVQSYIRLTTKSGELAVQILERTVGPKEEGFYTSVS